ncbi:TPT-domain-containing protein [Aureobasidium pullulans]|nr:TPT-domain-containing protein [Aureobasidium pullulans]
MLIAPDQLKLSHVGRKEQWVLVAFSVLFTVNIAISNVSLAMVSVPFHQIVRSTTPVATILIYRWLGRNYGTMTYVSLIPIVAGVGLSTYGDYYATLLGASLTFLGVFLAALKTVATNKLLTGSLKLPALELLLRMSPLAAVQSLLWATATGEVSHFLDFIAEGNLSTSLIIALLGNGFLAFLLNVTSFQTNKLAGALTLSVCGNVKQILTVILGIVLFNVNIGPMNAAGMIVALGGAAWYSKVELDVKRAASRS